MILPLSIFLPVLQRFLLNVLSARKTEFASLVCLFLSVSKLCIFSVSVCSNVRGSHMYEAGEGSKEQVLQGETERTGIV